MCLWTITTLPLSFHFAQYSMSSTFSFFLYKGLWTHPLFNSTPVCLLQAQRSLDQDIISHVRNQCLWIWILNQHNTSSSLQERFFLRPPVIISVSVTAVSLNLVISSTADFLPPLLWSQKYSLVKCYLSMCSPVGSKELESIQYDLHSLFLLLLSKNTFDIAWIYSSVPLKS